MPVKIDVVGELPDAPSWWRAFMSDLSNRGDLADDYPECLIGMNAALKIHNAKCVTTDAFTGYVEFETESDFVAFKLRFGV